MKKRITYISITFLLFMFVFSTHFFIHEPNRSNDIEVMRKVDSYQKALMLEDDFDISLLSYSTYGFATYYADQNDLKKLTDHDFIQSSYAKPISYEAQNIFSDPYENQQYALDMMDVDQTWTVTKGSTNTVIAIIDSGIDTDH